MQIKTTSRICDRSKCRGGFLVREIMRLYAESDCKKSYTYSEIWKQLSKRRSKFYSDRASTPQNSLQSKLTRLWASGELRRYKRTCSVTGKCVFAYETPQNLELMAVCTLWRLRKTAMEKAYERRVGGVSFEDFESK